MLFVQPLQEPLKSFIGQDSLNRIEGVSQFVVRPGFVNEILARMARRRDLSAAFAARDNVMSAGRHLPFTECAMLHDSSEKFNAKTADFRTSFHPRRSWRIGL